MHGQKNFTIFVLEILLKYQVTNWWLKNLLMWSNKEADFSPEINKSFIFHGMGLLLIFTFGVRTLDRSSEPVQCALAWLGDWKYDYINLHLNDNSSQIHLSIVFKLSDHKANICSYSSIAKILELLDILYFLVFFRKIKHTPIPIILIQLVYGLIGHILGTQDDFSKMWTESITHSDTLDAQTSFGCF